MRCPQTVCQDDDVNSRELHQGNEFGYPLQPGDRIRVPSDAPRSVSITFNVHDSCLIAAFAQKMRDRRTELRLKPQDVRAAGGPSPYTLRRLEGDEWTWSYPKAETRARIEKVYGWPEGTCRSLLPDPIEGV